MCLCMSLPMKLVELNCLGLYWNTCDQSITGFETSTMIVSAHALVLIIHFHFNFLKCRTYSLGGNEEHYSQTYTHTSTVQRLS